MDSALRFLASSQDDVVAAWQLRESGWSWGKIKHHVRSRGWRRLHRGVFLLTSSAPTRKQLWWGAALTRPESFLSYGSGGACYGFHSFDPGFEVITRPGHGGCRRYRGVLVYRSTTLADEVTRFDDIPITTAARVLVDLAAAGLDDRRLGRAFRESIRLKRTTAARVGHCARRHVHAPGASRLAALATRYGQVPYHRTRSDAEGRSLELLNDAGAERAEVNVTIAGEEADLVFRGRKEIIEIDGPQFHRFPDEDERKRRIWEEAGFRVRRIGSGEVYALTPEELVRRLELS
ncbi:MAG TPA: hypothetical protein VJT75_01090 [Thermoleophilaceae bacterium]|nr:hypothetical protein [Thermoleophilaceae bacterium]